MKKKMYLMAVLALLMQGVVSNNVWADGDDPIPFIILPQGGDGGGDVGGGDDNGGDNGEHSGPKSPVQMPTVVQDGYTLYIISGCTGATLILRDEYETEVYSTLITDEIILPTTLSGTYEIRLIRGSQTFVGEIELY